MTGQFCHQCGEGLIGTARFCSGCGIAQDASSVEPERDAPGSDADANVGPEDSELQVRPRVSGWWTAGLAIMIGAGVMAGVGVFNNNTSNTPRREESVTTAFPIPDSHLAWTLNKCEPAKLRSLTLGVDFGGTVTNTGTDSGGWGVDVKIMQGNVTVAHGLGSPVTGAVQPGDVVAWRGEASAIGLTGPLQCVLTPHEGDVVR